jgi:hypothetical protein
VVDGDRDGGEHGVHAVTGTVAVLLCVAAGVATLVALAAWGGLCREGTFERCQNGDPSFELVFQVVLALTGLGVAVMMCVFEARRSYRAAAAALAVALLIFAAWAVFLDAATHGWDDLKLLRLG